MGGPQATAAGERLERALSALIRQEFTAPVAAIVGFLDILLEDAQRHGFDAVVGDLERMRTAGAELATLVSELLEPARLQGLVTGDAARFGDRLRHDLRTPLNAIKGYGEMILEEAADRERAVLGADIDKVGQAVARLLAQIDGMVGFIEGHVGDAALATAPNLAIGDVVRTISSVRRSPSPEPGRTKSRILVVDDNPSNRDLLARQVRRDGHEVVAVEDGGAALSLCLREPFDLLLLDLFMPGMSGLEVLCRLKSDERLRNLPVIVISALDELDSVVQCIDAGAEDYLPKPVNPVLLRARIGACLEKKRLRDREQAFLHELQAEKDKSEALLLNILPRTIVNRIRSGETNIADRFSEATILFCDLVDFTSMAARMQPAQTVELLSEVFSRFDRLAAEHSLEKIKTIGDAYMVAGGLPQPRPDHAPAVANLALAMLDAVAAAGAHFSQALQVRIGIHTGAAVAGILGTHKFAYDVWGDTVNTASRLETAGKPGRIHVSAATRQALGDRFAFEARGRIAIKGKGSIDTYFLHGRR